MALRLRLGGERTLETLWPATVRGIGVLGMALISVSVSGRSSNEKCSQPSASPSASASSSGRPVEQRATAVLFAKGIGSQNPYGPSSFASHIASVRMKDGDTMVLETDLTPPMMIDAYAAEVAKKAGALGALPDFADTKTLVVYGSDGKSILSTSTSLVS